MDLRRFLALPHQFRWGGVEGDDCTTFCATWVAELTGTDPAAALRDTYHNEEGAHAILDRYGGLVPFIETHLSPLGFIRVDEPADGDIGVVEAPVERNVFKPIAGIRFGPLWAMLGPHGVRCTKVDHVAVWGLRQ